MKIALLDDGVELSLCPGLNLSADLIVEPTGYIRTRRVSEKIYTDHGTTCAQIIYSYVPDVELCSLQIFSGGTLKTDLRRLLAALGWCVDNQISLIHLSAGTTKLSDYSQIRETVYQMLSRGQLLVAAQSNYPDRYTLPACLNGVLCVAADPTLSGLSYRVDEYSFPGGTKIYASSSHKLSSRDSDSYKTQITNSYAAPTITAKLYQLLNQKGGNKDTLRGVYRDLDRQGKIFLHSMHPDFLVSAIIFDPYNMLTLTECLNFTPLYILDDYSIFFEKLREHPSAPVLLIPPIPNGTAFFRKLYALSQNRLGVAYAGHSKTLSSFPCLTWDESYRDVFFSRLPVSNSFCSNTPAIHIEPCNNDVIKIICKLRKILVAEGIESIILSDVLKSYLYGIEYLSETDKNNFPSILEYFSRVYSPDIIVYAFFQFNYGFPNKALHIKMSDSCTHFDIISDDVISFPCIPQNEDWHHLLEFLLSYDFHVS